MTLRRYILEQDLNKPMKILKFKISVRHKSLFYGGPLVGLLHMKNFQQQKIYTKVFYHKRTMSYPQKTYKSVTYPNTQNTPRGRLSIKNTYKYLKYLSDTWETFNRPMGDLQWCFLPKYTKDLQRSSIYKRPTVGPLSTGDLQSSIKRRSPQRLL